MEVLWIIARWNIGDATVLSAKALDGDNSLKF